MRRTRTIVRFISQRESESNLPLIRLSKGLSVAELMEAAKIHVDEYIGFSSGERSPIYLNSYKNSKAGDIKPAVKRILSVLHCDFADMFPRYECKLPIYYLTEDQITNISISNFSQLTINPFGEITELILSQLKDYKERCVIEETIINNNTLQSVGDMLSITRERVRQIQIKALKRLKRSHKVKGILCNAKSVITRL